MRRWLPLILVCCAEQTFAQCSWPITLQSDGSCIGTTISVNNTHQLSTIIWYQDGNAIQTTASTPGKPALQQAAHSVRLPFDLYGYKLVIPGNLYVDDKGDIFICDALLNNAVYEWTPAFNSWTVVAGGNGQGNAANQLYVPTGIVVDKFGNLYIADRGNNRIQKWAPGATSGVTVAGDGTAGIDAAHLNDPWDLTLDCNGDLIITDVGNSRVLRWTPGAPAGTVIAGANPNGGNTLADLSNPVGARLDAAGNLYVADQGNYRIMKWAPGATSGTVIVQGNISADPLNLPSGFAGFWVDGAGNCYFHNGQSTHILKWPAGATSGAGAIVYTSSDDNFLFNVFIDNKGSLWGISTKDNILEQLVQPSSIINTYKPTTPGHYWAVVTDVNGYTTNSDTIAISAPAPGPPSINITATATTIGLCTPVTFTATTTNAGIDPAYQWQVSTLDVGTDTNTYTNNIFGNGDRIDCILTAVDQNCRLVHDTSNMIVLTVDPENHATVSITASDTSTCIGTPIELIATVTNGAANPGLEWYVNGKATGDIDPKFIDSATGSQVVYCEITSDASCGLARSNSIPIGIFTAPSIPPGQIFYLPYGKDETIDPVINGNVNQWLWTPGTGLSDSTIANPIVIAPETRTYTLQATSPGGCKTSGAITVDVFTPLQVPSAFTPNGDGHNDVFYILGGPQNSKIKELAIYSRWGEQVFEVHDGVPGDPHFGWNGYTHGRPATPGTYVYIAVLESPNGGEKQFKGTLLLIR